MGWLIGWIGLLTTGMRLLQPVASLVFLIGMIALLGLILLLQSGAAGSRELENTKALRNGASPMSGTMKFGPVHSIDRDPWTDHT